MDDELDSTESEDSDRQVRMDEATATVLAAWRKRQFEERLAWGTAETVADRRARPAAAARRAAPYPLP